MQKCQICKICYCDRSGNYGKTRMQWLQHWLTLCISSVYIMNVHRSNSGKAKHFTILPLISETSWTHTFFITWTPRSQCCLRLSCPNVLRRSPQTWSTTQRDWSRRSNRLSWSTVTERSTKLYTISYTSLRSLSTSRYRIRISNRYEFPRQIRLLCLLIQRHIHFGCKK